jgi:hypothetical protein
LEDGSEQFPTGYLWKSLFVNKFERQKLFDSSFSELQS